MDELWQVGGTLFGAMVGGTLAIWGGHLAQSRANTAALERLKIEPLSRACSDLVARLDQLGELDVILELNNDFPGKERSMPDTEFRQLLSPISYWVTDKHSFETIMNHAFTELWIGWPEDIRGIREHLNASRVATAYHRELTSSLTRLPFQDQEVFETEVSTAMEKARKAKESLGSD